MPLSVDRNPSPRARCDGDRRSAASDRRIVQRLQRAAGKHADYWDFRDTAEDLASARLFQYPAMMVPQLQKQVIIAILHTQPQIQTLADPFLGSGTILALAMLNGRGFIGQDINPLSILIAKTRAFSLDHDALSKAVGRVNAAAGADKCRSYAVRFARQKKWFAKGANIALSRLYRAIWTEYSIRNRRFLWVCLAETVRLNSNSRTSTYKLHVKAENKRNATTASVLASFASISSQNLGVVQEFSNTLRRSGHLDSRGRYKFLIRVSYGDSSVRFPKQSRRTKGIAELVITSPPYGDNRTTVPYGQAAWLPLQWIDFADIDRSVRHDAIETAYKVDNLSLGGRRLRNLSERQQTVCKFSDSGAAYAASLSDVSREGLSRFINFAYDYHCALRRLASACTSQGHIVLTLGERNIAGIVCPLSRISAEFLKTCGVQHVTEIERQISSKRMPRKNSHSATITRELVSIYRKASPSLSS
jgi:hypothetical protein